MKQHPCLIDGEPFDRGPLPEGVFLRQYIRTTGIQGIQVERHAEILDSASRELFGSGLGVDARTVGEQITALLRDNGYPEGGLSFVTLRKYLSGRVVIAANGLLPYRQRKMRIIFPQAGIADIDPPYGDYPLSSSDEAFDIVRAQLCRRNSEIRTVIRRNASGLIVSADGAPVFIIEKGTVISPPPVFPSVEYESAVAAVRRAGFDLSAEEIDTERLLNADEIFYADCRGITAVSRCEGHLFVRLLTERIGDAYGEQDL